MAGERDQELLKTSVRVLVQAKQTHPQHSESQRTCREQRSRPAGGGQSIKRFGKSSGLVITRSRFQTCSVSEQDSKHALAGIYT